MIKIEVLKKIINSIKYKRFFLQNNIMVVVGVEVGKSCHSCFWFADLWRMDDVVCLKRGSDD
jgi:hypothetical protein